MAKVESGHPIILASVFGMFGASKWAQVTIVDSDGKHKTGESTSSKGPVDAVCGAIKAAVPHDVGPVSYHVDSSDEADNVCTVCKVRVTLGSPLGGSISAEISDADMLVALAKAYVAALNDMLSFDRKRALLFVDDEVGLVRN